MCFRGSSSDLLPIPVLAQYLHLLPRSVARFSPKFRSWELDPLTTYSLLTDPLRDHLCLSMRALSSRFRTLHLEDFRLSSAIFEGDSDGSYPDWSSLEQIHISYPVMSSTGDSNSLYLSSQVIRVCF